MANFNRPFGSNRARRTTDDNDTPQQKKFEAATGKDADNALGDVNVNKTEPASDPSASGVTAPSGVNKDVWAEAERSAVNMYGGFAGVGPEGRKAQIQKHYDQMVQNDKNLKEWAGEDNAILGDDGDSKDKKDK